MMNREHLGAAIASVATLRGEFILRSGNTASEYFDKYRFDSEPSLLRAIAEHLAPLIPPATDALAGLELGGVPIATALALHTGLRTVFVRKHAKEYGTCQLAEGTEVAGLRLLIVEDVVTSGGRGWCRRTGRRGWIRVSRCGTGNVSSNACRYGCGTLLFLVIKSFADRDTESLFGREPVRRFPAELQRTMLRQLVAVDAAEALDDLRAPPGNRLEKLKGDRSGQHSIRINDQWRVCFRWKAGDAFDVEIVDYH
jgi:orotate phosphoribosyltransferase